jgi:hypothetical protein
MKFRSFYKYTFILSAFVLVLAPSANALTYDEIKAYQTALVQKKPQAKTGKVLGATAPLITSFIDPVNCRTVDGVVPPAICNAPGELPSNPFSPPVAGGTYTDQNFGGVVRVLTSPNFDSTHGYSTPSALSATGKYGIYTYNDYYTTIVEAATGNIVKQQRRESGTWSNAGVYYWDPIDDDKFYYTSEVWNGTAAIHTELRLYSVSQNTDTLIVDYSKAPYNFSTVETGATGDMSKDKWISFWVPDQQKVCASNILNPVETYCANYSASSPLPWDFIDFSLITPGRDSQSGKRYVILVANPASGIFSRIPLSTT